MCAQGHCEGVVGKFHGADVTFTTKLKRPVLIPRNSLGAPPVTAPPASSTVTSATLPPSFPRSENLRESAARRSKSVDLPRVEHAHASYTKLDFSERKPTLHGPETSPARRPADAHLPLREREPKSSGESTAGDDSVIISTGIPGEQTEIFGAIFDSYRYSRGSEASSGAPSPSPSSPADSPASRRNSSPADMRRYKHAPSPSRSRLTPNSISEDFEDDDDESLPVTPLRYGAASALRTQLVAQHSAGSTPGLSPVPARSLLPASESNESVLTASIPRLRDLFPRSSTTDSFGSLSSLHSARTPNASPDKASPATSPASSTSSPLKDDKPAPPLPALVLEGDDDGVPVPRRLFQTYFTPSKAPEPVPRSKTATTISDYPTPISPKTLRKRRSGAKGLVIGSPVAIPGLAWRGADDEIPTKFDDIFSYANSASSTPRKWLSLSQ